MSATTSATCSVIEEREEPQNLNLNVISTLVETENKIIGCEKKVYEEFFTRLETFVQSYGDPRCENRWTCKPKEISPPICAKYGFKCVGKDLIECVTCKQIINGSLPKAWDSSVYKECVAEIFRKLSTTHHQQCPWKTTTVPDRVFKIQIGHKNNMLEEFKLRVMELMKEIEIIPAINEAIEIKMDWNKDYYSSIAQFLKVELCKVVEAAILLGVTGWSKSNKSETNLQCKSCLRNIYSSFYMQIKTEDNLQSIEQSEDTDLPSKKIKLLPKFDPLYEHWDWCQWVTPGLREEPNDPILGWKLYLTYIINNVTQSDIINVVTQKDIERASTQIHEWFETSEKNPN